MARAPFKFVSHEIGKLTEDFMNQWYEYHLEGKDSDGKWNNPDGKESHLVDFFMRHGTYWCGNEIERKDIKYERFWLKEGMDFLESKVEKYIDDEPEVYYTMVICDGPIGIESWSLPMKDMADFGELVLKPTSRGILEWFYRVPLEDLVYTPLSQK